MLVLFCCGGRLSVKCVVSRASRKRPPEVTKGAEYSRLAKDAGSGGLSRRRASVLGTRWVGVSFRWCGLRRAPAGATAGLVASPESPKPRAASFGRGRLLQYGVWVRLPAWLRRFFLVYRGRSPALWGEVKIFAPPGGLQSWAAHFIWFSFHAVCEPRRRFGLGVGV
jgi:hypothetical protein